MDDTQTNKQINSIQKMITNEKIHPDIDTITPVLKSVVPNARKPKKVVLDADGLPKPKPRKTKKVALDADGLPKS